MNELETRADIEAFAAELIDRFGKLPEPTDNLLKILEIKNNCRAASVVKLDVGPKGALVHFHNDSFPDWKGLIAYVQRLKGSAMLRPDSKSSSRAKAWPDTAGSAVQGGPLKLFRRVGEDIGNRTPPPCLPPQRPPSPAGLFPRDRFAVCISNVPSPNPEGSTFTVSGFPSAAQAFR
jgi:hypothetical protein